MRGRELHYNKKQQKEEVKRNEFTLYKEVKANESTSKLKEGREVVLVLACHPSNTTLYTLSLFHSNG